MARNDLNRDQQRALAWSAQRADVQRDLQLCAECGASWSPCGIGLPGYDYVRHEPLAFACVEHEAIVRERVLGEHRSAA